MVTTTSTLKIPSQEVTIAIHQLRLNLSSQEESLPSFNSLCQRFRLARTPLLSMDPSVYSTSHGTTINLPALPCLTGLRHAHFGQQ
jgi:hypothetical protein